MKIGKLIVSGLALAALAGTANADLLYSNPWDGHGNIYAAQNDPSFGNFAETFAFFSSGRETWDVTDVHFVGGYFNPAQQGQITGFTVRVYGDAGNAPGGLLSSTFVPAGSFSEVFINANDGFPMFQYDMDITSTQVSGDAWVSAVADLVFPPQWGMAAGIDNDPMHTGWQTFFGSPSRLGQSINIDITGKVAPAPAGLAVLGFGALFTSRRRRSN